MLYQHVDFCPYCGTDRPLDTAGRPRAETSLTAVHPTLRAPPQPAATALPAGEPAADLADSDLPPVMPDDRHISPLEVPSPLWKTTGRWIFTKGLLLVWFVLALGYAAYLLLGDNRKQEPAADEQTANSSAGSISPYASQQQTNVTPPATDTHTQSATPKPRVMPQYKDLPDTLRAARASLQDNNLSDARAAANAALARDPDNGDARALQRDIAAREQRRDNALQSADQCASQRAWACVQKQASDALAIDASSLHAQSLLERAILSTGWTPLTAPAAPATGALTAPASPATGGPRTVNGSPLPRSARTMHLPSSRDWGMTAPSVPNDSTASTPPPLPSIASAPRAVVTPDISSSVGATAPASSTDAASAASTDNGLDAQQRAILESGWKHAAPPPDAPH
ncbi:zinc ribbon domain-containing protein [Paraburkholderia rhizosphaerae]|uniref:zinc ribbon domain-containing protein n=1 Tax=Paraburkholderia rhizosphaerae TaxID=480658 RepID=UPI0036726D00